jgi:hypothetical protein
MKVIEPRSTLSQCTTVAVAYLQPSDGFPVTGFGVPAAVRAVVVPGTPPSG